ncbi:MAG: hypothetical protein LBU50_00265, partial [Cellulomonas sp.]|nr:hypothetical protein [Cellulomonas sp.]
PEALSQLAEITEDGSDSGDAMIRVIKSDDHGTARWIVLIPSVWPWLSEQDRNTDGTCLAEPGDRRSSLETAVTEAMRQAGIGLDDQVMLAGFSLGGTTAARLAADRSFTSTYHVTAVFTAGSPVARIHISDGVQVLSIEHEDDSTPQLDDQDNPDRANWTTVIGSTPNLPGPAILPGDIEGYVSTTASVLLSGDASVDYYLTQVKPFLEGDQTAADYRATRTR